MLPLRSCVPAVDSLQCPKPPRNSSHSIYGIREFLGGSGIFCGSLLRLGLKDKGTEEEFRAPVPWASPPLSLKPPKNKNQREETMTGGEEAAS